MSPPPGSRLGAYAIVGRLGAGGMGEVYRATDSKLDRDVAIKLLPAELAQDPERLARFEREAKLLASLNHTNVAHVYGFESATLADGSSAHFLAMELVEGEDLAERLKRGAIPVDEAIAIAKQIAEALEEAHERGIVHRDLKPANVKLTPDGKVKVLDFGLAKAWAGDGAGARSSADLSQSPTLAHTGTQAGVILGTAAYMSPEQARGKPVDRRADIWAFGVVLFELLTAQRLFEGETVSDVLAGVLARDPDMGALPAATPGPVRRLIARCLERDPKQRLRDVGEARIVLSAPHADAVPRPEPARGGRRQALAWTAALALTAALAATAARRFDGAPTPPVVRASIQLPPGMQLAMGRATPPALAASPDGSMVAFAAMPLGATAESAVLYVRRLDQAEAILVPDSEGARVPFFAPDGRSVAFGSGSRLRRASLSGGAPVTIAERVSNLWGGSWLADGTIVYSHPMSSGEMLFRVPEAGGEARLLSRVERMDTDHSFPHALPGGQLLVTMWTGGLYTDARLARLSRAQGAAAEVLVEGGSNGHVLPGGPLVYARGSELLAVPFDERRGQLAGTPVKVLEGVLTDENYATPQFDVSPSGLLAYAAQGRPPTPALVRLDPAGRLEPVLEDKLIEYPRLSPDGRLVVYQGMEASRELDLWSYDLVSRRRSRLTHTRGEETDPVFAPDGRTLVFAGWRETASLSRMPLTGGPEAPLAVAPGASDLLLRPSSFSPDGRWLAVVPGSFERGNSKLGVLDMQVEPLAARWLFDTAFTEDAPVFSPRGGVLAYVSNQLGRRDVWLVAFPDARLTPVPVSRDGGTNPFWSRDGRTLYYTSGTKLYAATVEAAEASKISEPRPVLDATGLEVFAAEPGGSFLAVRRDRAPVTRIEIVLNWAAEVRQRLAAAGSPR